MCNQETGIFGANFNYPVKIILLLINIDVRFYYF